MSPIDRYRQLTLRAKLSLWTTLGALLIVAAMAATSLWVLRQATMRGIVDAQSALIDGITHDLDDKIALRRTALAGQATVLGHRVPMDGEDESRYAAVDDYFSSRPLLVRLFNAILVVDAHGTIVYDAPRRNGRVGLNVSDRPYFRDVMRTGEPVLARPMLTKSSGRPALNMAAPVRDAKGVIVAVLVGALYLDDDASILGEVGARRVGASGHLAVLSVADGTAVAIAHPQRARLLETMRPADNPGLARALAGESVTLLGDDVGGEPLLYSYGKLKSVPWVVQAVYPTLEAYAGLRQRERELLAVGAVIALAAGLAVWTLTTRLLRPLDALRRAMNDTGGAGGTSMAAEIDVHSADLAALLQAYRSQQARRLVAETARAYSEKRLKAIADNLPALIGYVDREERYRFVNAHYRRVFEIDPAWFLGKSVVEVLGEAGYAVVKQYVDGALAGVHQRFERHGPRHGDSDYWLADYIPDVNTDGTVEGYYVMVQDITLRRHAEVALAESERRMRAITDNMPALIAHYDRDERLTFANAKIVTVRGQTAEAMIGRTMSELRAGQYPELQPHAARALAGETVTFDLAMQSAGKLRQYHSTYVPDVSPDGGVQGFFALTLDMTERREAELRQAASEQKLLDLANALPAMVGYFDLDQRCLYANDTGLRSLGVERSEVPGIDMRSALGEVLYAQHEPYLDDVLRGARSRFEGKTPFRDRDAHYQAHLIPDWDASGVQRGFYLMTFDITALKEAQQRQARVEHQLRDITDNLPALISYIDRDERVQFLNRTFGTWTGVDPATLIGRPLAEIAGADEYASGQEQLHRAYAGERVAFDAVSMMGGVRRYLQTVYIPDIASDGRIDGLYALTTDVTALKSAEEQLKMLVRCDVLTGLANRYRFNEALPEALARAQRAGHAMALMFLDIDHFKQINDTHGHAVGDEALQEFASRLQSCVRVTDLVARLAGDEFVIILEGLHNHDEPQEIARKIIADINRPFKLSTGPLGVTTSLGIAYQPCGSADEDDLLARADAALYAAKAAGRNTFVLSAADAL